MPKQGPSNPGLANGPNRVPFGVVGASCIEEYRNLMIQFRFRGFGTAAQLRAGFGCNFGNVGI